MATNALQYLHHHSYSLLKHQETNTNHNSSTSPSSLFLKPTLPSTTSLSTHENHISLKHVSVKPTTTIAFSTTTNTTPSTSMTFSLDLLTHHLSNQDFRQADEETRHLLIVLAGEAAQKRGYVFFSEVQFISAQDLKSIDELWRKYSNDKFGYSLQKRLFEKKANKDFTKLFIKLGWMKKLESSEVEQYNYRSFPDEFIWELNDDTPEGHLPLTNALRGTQLFNSILNHPAFDDVVEDNANELVAAVENGSVGSEGASDSKDQSSSSTLRKGVFKPDYSF